MECPGFLALAKLGRWTPRSAEKMHRFYTILGLASMIGPLQKQLIPRVRVGMCRHSYIYGQIPMVHIK